MNDRSFQRFLLAMFVCTISIGNSFAVEPLETPNQKSEKELRADAESQSQKKQIDDLLKTCENLLRLIESRESVEQTCETEDFISALLIRTNQFGESVRHANRSLELSQSHFGKDHWQTVSRRWSLDYYKKLQAARSKDFQRMLEIEDRYNELLAVEKYAEAATEIGKLVPFEAEILGLEHPISANTWAVQADCWMTAEEYEAAERAATKALAVRSKHLGEKHPDTAMAAWYLAQARIHQGKHEAAIQYLELAAMVWRATGNHIDAAWMDSWRGYSLAALDRFDDAARAYTNAASQFTVINEHGNAGQCHSELAFLLKQQNKPANAAEEFRLAASEHDAAGSPLESFTCRLRSAELFAKARLYDDAVKAISDSSKHAAAAARTMSEDELLEEFESVISAVLPLFDKESVVVEALEAWSKLTDEIGAEQSVAGAWADTLLSSKLSTSEIATIFNAEVKWRKDVVRRWKDRSLLYAFLIQKDHARLLDLGRHSELSSIEECYAAYNVLLSLSEGDIGDEFQSLRSTLIVEASIVAEEIENGGGLRTLEKNKALLLKHLKGKSLWQMYTLRSRWLIKANRPEEGVADLFAAVDAQEADDDVTDIEMRNSLAELVLAAKEANGEGPIDEAEERARRRLIIHLTKMNDRASLFWELASLRRRLALGGKKEKGEQVLEQLFTAARGFDGDTATPADLTAAVSVLGEVAGELESTGLLVPSRITSDLALVLCNRLPMPIASGMKLGLLGHQLALAQAGGQTERVLVLADSIKSLRPSSIKQLSLWSESLPRFEFGSRTSHNATYVISLCQNARYLLVQAVATDIRLALAEATELDNVIDKIGSLLAEADGTDSEFAKQAHLSRAFLWDTIQTRFIDGSESLTEAERKFVADMRQAAFVEYNPDESEVQLQQLYTEARQLIFRYQNLSEEERDNEQVLKGIAKEVASIAKKLLKQPIIYERDVAIQILTACCFVDLMLGNFESVADTAGEAADLLEKFVLRMGGPPHEIIARSQQLRSGLDPYTFGLMASALNDDPNTAFEFAARGRSLGSRIAWQRTRDLSNVLANESRPAWLPAGSRLSLEEQYSASTSTNSERQGQLSAALGDQIASYLQPDERYILISTLHGTLAGDHSLTNDVCMFFIRPKTHSEPGIQYFERGTDSALVDESVPKDGVYVINVVSDSAAFQMGIRPRDIIKKVAGVAVTPKTFADDLKKTSAAQNIEFSIYRDGKLVELVRRKPAQSLGVLFSSSSPREAERRSREINSPRLAEARTFQVASLSNRGWSTRSSRSAELIEDEDGPLLSAKGESYRLFRSLFPTEVWEELKSVRKVYLSVPGQLAGLPLETLVVEPPSGSASEKDTVRWIDVAAQIAYLPLASIVPIDPDSDVQPAKLAYLGIGDVDFTSIAGVELPSLPNTRREIESISQVFERDSVKVLVGPDAIEESLFDLAPQARVISIATHGQFKDGLDTLETNVLLGATTTRGSSESPEQRRNGKLTLRDLLTDWRGRLPTTELTILSACQTGGGLVTQEDGTVGLPFGFLAGAGSDAVIASQWPVDDARTADLFSQMFTNRGDDEDMLSAFTKARQKLRSQHPDPHYWAPFIYISSH